MTLLTIRPKMQQQGRIELAPESMEEEIMQNINTIFLTPKFSVPLFRRFGQEAAYLDKPLLAAQAAIRSELFAVIPKYEPRVRVEAISFENPENYDDEAQKLSTLIPEVQVRIL